MRVLFIANNPEDQPTLTLEREITELQRRLGLSSGNEVEFRFLPALPVEDITSVIIKFQPDVLHLSAHGNAKTLQLANADGQAVEITGSVLAAMVDVTVTPKLVYVNACNSARIAEQATKVVPIAVGTTATITNRAARASALIFYERLLSGATVEQAFRSSNALLRALERGKAQSMLFPTGSALPRKTALVDVPRIIAQFPIDRDAKKFKANWKPDGDDEFALDVGIAGCPADVTQVVFFTDDETMSDEEEGWGEKFDFAEDEERAAEYAKIVYGPPVRGKLWCDSWWYAAGDFRIFATGVTGSGRSFTAYAMVCDALEAGLKAGDYKGATAKHRAEMADAIAQLRLNDGS